MHALTGQGRDQPYCAETIALVAKRSWQTAGKHVNLELQMKELLQPIGCNKVTQIAVHALMSRCSIA